MSGERGSRPSNEDLALWRGIARTTKPLRKRDGRAKAPEAGGGEAEEAEQPARRPRPATVPRKGAAGREPALVAGAPAGVDRRTADRLRRGKLPIEARLDLHGMTQAEARSAVTAFIAEGARAGRRCLLVITGKGAGREGGVLRQSLPGWLNEPANRARLVAFAPAQPQHGGHGALYLLLKRARD